MKRLFLTSNGLSAFASFVGKDPKTVNIGFVPTAADLYQDKWFVERDRKFLFEKGFKIIDVNIKDGFQLEKLNDVDVIYIAGGNTFYLLEKAVESGALELIKILVNKGKLYAGSSAGAIFAGPSIEPVTLLDDPKDAPNLKTYEGLGLVDFVVLPHYGKEKYLQKYEKIIENFKEKYELITLTDEQAIVFEGDSYKVIESK
jgi:dipeptidase E